MVQEFTNSTILNLLCLKNKVGPTDLSADSTPYLNFYVTLWHPVCSDGFICCLVPVISRIYVDV